MKDEIKEIIESSRKIIKSNRENGFDRIIMLGDDIDKLLDCITNLQEENKRLRKDYGRLIQDNAYTLELEQRNEKAVEYIENENICREELPKYARIEINNFDKKYRNDLLNILQGGDEE